MRQLPDAYEIARERATELAEKIKEGYRAAADLHATELAELVLMILSVERRIELLNKLETAAALASVRATRESFRDSGLSALAEAVMGDENPLTSAEHKLESNLSQFNRDDLKDAVDKFRKDH